MSRLKTYYVLAFVAFTVACSFGAGPQVTQEPPPGRDASMDGIWQRVTQEIIGFEKTVVKVKPESYASFQLRPDLLDDALKRAPKEFTADPNHTPAIISLPRPDGKYVRFQIEESPVMSPGLAERFPRIKTYRGRGIDDRTATVRLERTPLGLHAMVLSADGAFFVDSVSRVQANLYVSYFKKSLPPDPDQISCKVVHKRAPGERPKEKKQHTSSSNVGVLRVYRLAVAVSHRYVQAIHDLSDPSIPLDPLEEALIAITRTVNRIDLIFETDVGVRFVLVDEEPRIIYTNAANDPYNDSADPDDLLELNQQNFDNVQVLGSDKYDIGHLFIVEPGGVASQPCACSPYYKAQGLSGSPHPTGNAFDVQYVAHEMAHQLNASHSFNGSTRGCLENRNESTAYEPGSGSTIMSYAGATSICGAETVQAFSDPYFHAISLKEIRGYITSSRSGEGNTCAQKINTQNLHKPVVNGGPDFTVPGQTPFALTVQSGSDGDGDALTFTWEQFNLGPPDPPHPEQPDDFLKNRPLFRSWPGTLDTLRVLPAMQFLMTPPAAGVYIAEAMAANNRTMTFRVTARDSRGLFGYDDVKIKVVSKYRSAAVGPFAVQQPNASAVWPRGSTQTVTWAVARSDRAPIRCSLVRIFLVIRGDESHPILLADNVPNNGSMNVTVPSSVPLTTMARIRIQAVNNIFFALSVGDFQIVDAAARP